MNTQRLILAGGTGFLGKALSQYFTAKGGRVIVLTRHPDPSSSWGREVFWDGENVGPWKEELEGAAAVVNLAGRSVDCRYTAANRRVIMDSRVKPTRVLGEAIAQCANPPATWLNASSATFYRHTLDEAWDESGTDFRSTPAVHDEFSIEVIKAWEGTLNKAPVPGTRVLALRTTMVLGHGRNSVFPVLCRLARLGLGGRMGSGGQFVSWIHIDDFCRAVEWLLAHHEISGPVNVAAPHPLKNAEMMSLFRQLVGMPVGLPAFEWMLEIGAFFLRTETELILKSRRVVPGKLLATGFTFDHPTFKQAIANLHLTQP